MADAWHLDTLTAHEKLQIRFRARDVVDKSVVCKGIELLSDTTSDTKAKHRPTPPKSSDAAESASSSDTT